MKAVKFVHWQEPGFWLGYLQDYPDYLTQGESLEELKENLQDLYRDVTSGGDLGVITMLSDSEPLAGEPRRDPQVNPPPGEGEDDSLILWMPSLTPTQRLGVAQGFVDSVRVLRQGARV
jgi:predicted RNase H-like HicB family nuclease